MPRAVEITRLPDYNPHLGDRDEFVEKNKRLVHSVCKKYTILGKSKGFDYDDLYSMGCIGLIKAYAKFDPTKFEKVTRFSTYGVPMIKGEIQRYIRDADVGPRFSRSTKELVSKLIVAGDRDLSVQEIMEKYEEKEWNVSAAKGYLNMGQMKSLDDIVFENDGDPIRLIDQLIDQQDYTGILAREFVDSLPDKQRRILQLRVEDDIGQSEIGAIVGVSQVQVSRLLKDKITPKLAEYLGRDVEEMSRSATGNMLLAKKLLKESEMTLTEIARETGCVYVTLSKMSRDMKRPNFHHKSTIKDKSKESGPVTTRQMTDEERQRLTSLQVAVKNTSIATDLEAALVKAKQNLGDDVIDTSGEPGLIHIGQFKVGEESFKAVQKVVQPVNNPEVIPPHIPHPSHIPLAPAHLTTGGKVTTSCIVENELQIEDYAPTKTATVHTGKINLEISGESEYLEGFKDECLRLSEMLLAANAKNIKYSIIIEA
jgi:RNA polymerase sporulation-specific sigma factor